jgi:hypothetical protein
MIKVSTRLYSHCEKFQCSIPQQFLPFTHQKEQTAACFKTAHANVAAVLHLTLEEQLLYLHRDTKGTVHPPCIETCVDFPNALLGMTRRRLTSVGFSPDCPPQAQLCLYTVRTE